MTTNRRRFLQASVGAGLLAVTEPAAAAEPLAAKRSRRLVVNRPEPA